MSDILYGWPLALCSKFSTKLQEATGPIKQADGNDRVNARGMKIKGQRLKFDNYLVIVCETTIEQILFIATDKIYNQNGLNSCIYHSFVISI